MEKVEGVEMKPSEVLKKECAEEQYYRFFGLKECLPKELDKLFISKKEHKEDLEVRDGIINGWVNEVNKLKKLVNKDVLVFVEDNNKLLEENQHLKEMLKIHFKDLKKQVEADKELKKGLEVITKAIVKEKVEKPKNLYEFPKKGFTERDLAKWFDYTENFYHFARRWEQQERGMCCCVDRAYRDWLIPECKKLLKKLKVLK